MVLVSTQFPIIPFDAGPRRFHVAGQIGKEALPLVGRAPPLKTQGFGL